MTGRLEGKVAIITGGGGGLGREIASAYVSEGCAVVVSSHVPDQDESVAAECRDAGGQAIAISTDVRQEDAVRSLVDGALAAFDRVDVLIAAAGVAGTDESGAHDRATTVRELTLEQWNRVISVNLTGVFLAARAVIPHMIRQRSGGSIASFSSASVRFPALPAFGPYVVSKFGLEGLTRKLAVELDEFDIRVNTIQPGGATYTPMLGDRFGRGRPETMHAASVIRGLAVYVASDESRKVTGRSLVADEFNRQRGLDLCPCTRCAARPNPLEAEWHDVIAV